MGNSSQITSSPRKSPPSSSLSRTTYSSPHKRNKSPGIIHLKTESTRGITASTPHRSHKRKASAGVLSTPQRVLRNNLLQKSLSRSREASVGFSGASRSPTPSSPASSKSPSPTPFPDLKIKANSSASTGGRPKAEAATMAKLSTSANNTIAEAAEYRRSASVQESRDGPPRPSKRNSNEPAKKKRKGSPEFDEQGYKARVGEDRESSEGEHGEHVEIPGSLVGNEQGGRGITPGAGRLRTSPRRARRQQPLVQQHHVPTLIGNDTSAFKPTSHVSLHFQDLEDDDEDDVVPTQKDEDDDPNWEIINDDDIIEAPPSRGSAQTPSRPGSTSSPRRGAGGSLKQGPSLRKVITGRVSKFKEGSMNDRVSARPPEGLLLNYVDSHTSQSSAMMPTYRPTASNAQREKLNRKTSTSATGANSVLTLANRQGQDGVFYNSKGELITGKEEFTLTGLLGSIFHGKTLEYCRDNWWGPARKKIHDRMLMNERKERATAAYAAMKEKKGREEFGEGLTTIGRAVTTPAGEKVEMESLRGAGATGPKSVPKSGPIGQSDSLNGSHKRKFSQLTHPAAVPSFQFNDFGGRVPIDYNYASEQNLGEDQVEGRSGYSGSHAESASGSGSPPNSGDGSACEDGRLSIPGAGRGSKDKGKQKDANEGGSGSSLNDLKKRASKILLLGSWDKDKDKRNQSQSPTGEEMQMSSQMSFSSVASAPPMAKRQLSKREVAKAERLKKKVSTLEMKLLETWKELEAMGEAATDGMLTPPPPPLPAKGTFHGNGNYGSVPPSPRLSVSSDHVRSRAGNYGNPAVGSRSTVSFVKQEPGVGNVGFVGQPPARNLMGSVGEETGRSDNANGNGVGKVSGVAATKARNRLFGSPGPSLGLDA